jgi:hypothetical protein
MNSGNYVLVASISGFDPHPTLDLIRDKKVRGRTGPALALDSQVFESAF